MYRQGARALIFMLFAFSILGLGQQLNPFTAVLTEPITRSEVKAGRKRDTLKIKILETTTESKITAESAKQNHSRSKSSSTASNQTKSNRHKPTKTDQEKQEK